MTCANPGGRSLAYPYMHMAIVHVKEPPARVIVMIDSFPEMKKPAKPSRGCSLSAFVQHRCDMRKRTTHGAYRPEG